MSPTRKERTTFASSFFPGKTFFSFCHPLLHPPSEPHLSTTPFAATAPSRHRRHLSTPPTATRLILFNLQRPHVRPNGEHPALFGARPPSYLLRPTWSRQQPSTIHHHRPLRPSCHCPRDIGDLLHPVADTLAVLAIPRRAS